MSTPSSPTRPQAAALVTLLGASAGLSALAVYQWVELLSLRSGLTPACAVNDTINCATVWDSPFAALVHDTLGMPVAALGLLWGLTALLLALGLVFQGRAGVDTSVLGASVKLWAAVGLVSTVALAGASVQAKALCLTCLGTYALTIVFAVGAFVLLPKPAWPDARVLMPGGAWALVISAPLFIALLYPGGRTPKSTSKVEVQVAVAGEGGAEALRQWMSSLSERDKLQTAWAREVYLSSQPRDVSMFPVRTRIGPADAPVRVVEFTDILCGHCRVFEQLLGQLMAQSPGRISVEPRYFPLDGECNPEVQHVAGDGIRCFGAKAQLCLEKHPRFMELRHELFSHQSSLTKDFIVQVAAKAGLGEEALSACVNSAETQARLAQDIAYAKAYGITGTPLVLVNGREAPAAPAFLIGLVLAGGDARAPIFDELPPAPRD